MSDEWELMMTADDIEPGDYVKVITDGFQHTKMMVHSYDAKTIYLIDNKRESWGFSRSDLSRKNWHIVGKTTPPASRT